MGIVDVTTGEYAFLIAYVLFAVDYFDAAAAACRDRLQNVERFFVLWMSSVSLKLTVLFLQDVAHWCNRKLLRELDPQPIHVSPE